MIRLNRQFIDFYKHIFGESNFNKYKTVLNRREKFIHCWLWNPDEKLIHDLESNSAEKLSSHFPIYQLGQNKYSQNLINKYRNSSVFQQALDSQLTVWSTYDSETENLKILDLCCSPGSKLSQILYKTANNDNSIIFGNDISITRLKQVRDRFKNIPIHSQNLQNNTRIPSNLILTNVDGQLWPTSIEKFNIIYCDVPCTGDGTFNKIKPGADPRTWSVSNAFRLSKIQINLLKKSIELTKPGGFVVYSTCSMNPIENEFVVDNILKEYSGDVELVNVEVGRVLDNKCDFVTNGLSSLDIQGCGFDNKELVKCVRFEPFKTEVTGGFFMVKLRKLKATNGISRIEYDDFKIKIKNRRKSASEYRHNLLELRKYTSEHNILTQNERVLDLFKEFESRGGSPVKILF